MHFEISHYLSINYKFTHSTLGRGFIQTAYQILNISARIGFPIKHQINGNRGSKFRGEKKTWRGY